VATDSECGALGQRDDVDGRLEASGLLLERGGLHVSHELVDAGETFGGVVAFDWHVQPYLSGREKLSHKPKDSSVLFWTVRGKSREKS
jgi:hypothetical protein